MTLNLDIQWFLIQKGGVNELSHFRLEAGNYALVRIEDRTQNIPWGNIALNENESKLYWTNKADANGQPLEYTDNTYVIVEINKNISDVHIELADNNFSNLISSLEKKDKQNADSWKITNDAIIEIVLKKSQIISFTRAKEILSDLSRKTVSLAEKRVLAKELMIMVSKSIDKNGEPLKIDLANNISPLLTGQQVQYVLKKIREIAVLNKTFNKSKLSEDDLANLETSKIFAAFGEGGTSTSQKTILDLIAPL